MIMKNIKMRRYMVIDLLVKMNNEEPAFDAMKPR